MKEEERDFALKLVLLEIETLARTAQDLRADRLSLASIRHIISLLETNPHA